MQTPHLSGATKAKLLMPLLYFGLVALFFNLSWPKEIQIHHVAGMFLTVIAFGLWIVARIQLGNAFSIAPSANYLVTSGLYSKLRHPVYYFSLLATIGIGIYIWNILAFLFISILIALQLFRIHKEEKVLRAKFGNQYTNYKATTWF